MDVVRQIAKVPTDMYEKPRIPVHVLDCGEIGGKAQMADVEETNAVAEYKRLREEKMKAKQQKADKKLQEENKEDQLDADEE